MSDERQRVRLHEAGHAVVAVHLGLHLVYATVRSSDWWETQQADGCLEVKSRQSDGHVMVKFDGHVDLGNWCVMALAGRAVERRAFGDCRDSPSDVSEARRCLAFELFTARKATEDEIDAALPAYQAKADQLVASDWAWIQRVAGELDRMTGLFRDEIVALQEGALAA